jgi:hypothetical protein
MALLYPWATKEYLLWKMSLGQLILYYNLGMDIKYPKVSNGDGVENKSLRNMSPEDVAKVIADLRNTYGEIGNGQ